MKSKIIRMNITITPKQRGYLRKQAYLADKNMSWIVRRMINENLEKEKNKK